MAFLTTDEMKTHVFPYLTAALDPNDEGHLDTAISAAIAEAKSYCSRYDLNSLFGVSGNSRDLMLLRWVKDIAKWHFIALANPEIDYDDALLRYEKALTQLGQVQSGKLVPEGWPLAVQPKHASKSVFMTSNPKRKNHY